MSKWLKVVGASIGTAAALAVELAVFAWLRFSDVTNAIGVWNWSVELVRYREWITIVVLVFLSTTFMVSMLGLELSHGSQERIAWWRAAVFASLGCHIGLFLAPAVSLFASEDHALDLYGLLGWMAPIFLIGWIFLALLSRQYLDPHPSRMRAKWIVFATASGVLVLALVSMKPSDTDVSRALGHQLEAQFPDDAFRQLVATRLAARKTANRYTNIFLSNAAQDFLANKLQDSSEVRAVTDRVRKSIVEDIQSSPVHRMDLCWGIYLHHETQYVDVGVEAHYGTVRVRGRWLHLLSERSPLDSRPQRRFVSPVPEHVMRIVDRALDEELKTATERSPF